MNLAQRPVDSVSVEPQDDSGDDEAGRLAALRALELLDTAPEQELDELIRLASYIAKAPMSALSLVDAERLWFKSRVGLDMPETAREASFCATGRGHDCVGRRRGSALPGSRFC